MRGILPSIYHLLLRQETGNPHLILLEGWLPVRGILNVILDDLFYNSVAF